MPTFGSFRGTLSALLGATLLLCLSATLVAAPAAHSAPSRASYIVVLKDSVAHPAYLAHRHEENRGAEVDHIYGVAIKGYSAELTQNELRAIKKDPNVDYVESDGVISPKGQAVGNQLKRVYANQSKLHIDQNDVPSDRVNADIAILDTGVYAHPDLNVVSRVNCVGGGGCKPGTAYDDLNGHGTHVAGDAAAIDNGIGMVGTAPGARIWSVKVVDKMSYGGADQVGTILSEPPDTTQDLQLGNAQMSDAIAGIDYVTAHSSEIEVANMSFACATANWGCAHTALKEAIATSVNNGVVWVAAAGHDGDAVTGIEQVGLKYRYYPALLSDVITVSAMADYDGLPGSLSNSNGCSLEKGTQVDDRLMGPGKTSAETQFSPEGSNFGPEVDMTAPGSCVFSTWSPYPLSNRYDIPYKAEYGFMYGSSVASALVAGVAADLTAEFNPNNRAEVEGIKSVLIGSGNYDWQDLISAVPPAGPFYSPDGVKEPLLDMGNLAVPVQPPTVLTNPAVNVGSTSARLNGWVNANGAATSYAFEYGRSTYENSIPIPAGSAGWDTSSVSVWNDLTGLEPGATYHYRVTAWNSAGKSYGADQPFTTPTDFHPVSMRDSSTGAQWAYYRNADGYIYELYRNPSTGQWANTKVPATQPAAAGTSPVIGRNATSKAQWIYYQGADRGIWELYRNPSTGQWANSKLPGALATPGSSPAMAGDPTAGAAWIYYRNNDGYIWELYRNPSTGQWANTKVPATQAAAGGTAPAVLRSPTTGAQLVYYASADGGIWELYRNPSTGQWANTRVPYALAGAGSSPALVGDPSAGAAWIYYRAWDGYIWELYRNPSTGQWANTKVPATQAAAAGTAPAVLRSPTTSAQLVYYQGADGGVWELYRNPTTGNWSNTRVPGAMAGTWSSPSMLGDPSAGAAWIYYRGYDGYVWELWRNPSTGVWTNSKFPTASMG